jgi:hypothetical protein
MLSIPSSAFAEYYANGEIIGFVHSGIGKYLPMFIKPTQKIVHSVKQQDGKIYKMKRVFKNSEVTINPQGECVVHPDHEPTLLSMTPEGYFEELHNVIYLEFTCYKE